jgi:hypothetical protein
VKGVRIDIMRGWCGLIVTLGGRSIEWRVLVLKVRTIERWESLDVGYAEARRYAQSLFLFSMNRHLLAS